MPWIADLILLAAIWGGSFLLTLTTTFLIPVFGVAYGNLFAGEQITPRMALGGLAIPLGTALSLGLLAPRRGAVQTPKKEGGVA